MHPGREPGPSVEDFFPHWRRGKNGPWLAHRLDRDTAGCLVIARKKATLHELQAAFAAGLVGKTYWAIVHGLPAAAGTVDEPLAKTTHGRHWRMAPGPGGQRAVTHWRLAGVGNGFSWLELKPATGRTHQIRAHCAQLGHPILGDAVYGSDDGAPLMLLARGIVLPIVPPAAATAPVPPHMRSMLSSCGHAK